MNNESQAVESPEPEATPAAPSPATTPPASPSPAKPQAADATPSQAPTAETSAAADSSAAESAAAGNSAAGNSGTESSAAEPNPGAAAEAPPAEAPLADRPSDRIKLGASRDEGKPAGDAALRPKPVNRVTESTAPQSSAPVEVPTARTAATAEEEAELNAMMAGATVGAVLDSSDAAAPPEIAPQTRLTGKVLRVSGDSVFVELGPHQQGAVPLKQFEPKSAAADAPAAVAQAPTPKTTAEAAGSEAPATEAAAAEAPADTTPVAEPAPADAPAESAAPADDTPASYAPAEGSELEVLVLGLNAEEGIYDLTLPTAAVDVGDWDEVEAGKVVEVTITGKNKGGLECKVSGIRGFMPMGQISIYRVEDADEFIGQRLTAVITEANRSRKNVILSHRAIMERERAENRDKLLADLAPGQMRDGVVRSLRDFGAFVDLGGVDGLVHVSKLSWDRVNHPSEVLKEGETIKVKVEKVDRESGKIALSYREAAANPWDSAEADYPVGSTAKGRVSKVMDFGAFVRLAAGVEGLVHISELDHKRVHRVTDVVSEGQDVEAKVLSVDRGKQRIALSLKALKAAPAKPERKRDDLPEEPEEKRPPRKQFKNLKGGTGGPSGDGEKFGLKW